MTTKKKTTTKKTAKLTVWQTLSQVDCSEHIEKKGSFNYLSWAWAWGILMEHYPESTFENHLNSDGFPCFLDANNYAMVRVTVRVFDSAWGELSHTEDFPVLDYKNKAIQNPNSFEVNTALKRCMVKCLAYFGLAHYIYAGEDTPPTDEKFDRDEALQIISEHIENIAASDWEKNVLDHFHCDNWGKLRDDELVFVLKRIGTSTNKKEGK